MGADEEVCFLRDSVVVAGVEVLDLCEEEEETLVAARSLIEKVQWQEWRRHTASDIRIRLFGGDAEIIACT